MCEGSSLKFKEVDFGKATKTLMEFRENLYLLPILKRLRQHGANQTHHRCPDVARHLFALITELISRDEKRYASACC